MGSEPDLRPIFYLIPESRAAKEAVYNKRNCEYRKSHDGYLTIDLVDSKTVNNPSQSVVTLATLGRGYTADIFLDSKELIPHHCSLAADLQSGIVTLISHGQANNVYLYGEYAGSFSPEDQPRAVLLPKLNTKFMIGSIKKFCFTVRWEARDRSEALLQVQDKARGLFGGGSVQRNINDGKPKMKEAWHPTLNFIEIDEISLRSHIAVHRVIDEGTCRLIAVKKMTDDNLSDHQEAMEMLIKEVKVLSQTSHSRVVKFLGSQGWEVNKVKIFMESHEGRLANIGNDPPFKKHEFQELCLRAFQHALEGLHYLHDKEIVHGDIQVGTILYSRDYSKHGPQSYNFVLAGFGYSVKDNEMKTSPKFGPYMAPEFFDSDFIKITCKADIWSLYVTMLATQFFGEFEESHARIRRKIERLERMSMVFTEGGSISQKSKEFCRDREAGTVWEIFRDMVKTSPRRRPFAWEALEIMNHMDASYRNTSRARR